MYAGISVASVKDPQFIVFFPLPLLGKLIKRIDAIDFDLGKNKELRYRIVDGDRGIFRIDAKTGDLLVRRPVRRRANENSVFNLLVEAEDGGNPAMASRVNVPIKVVTDSQPVRDAWPSSTQVIF